MQDREARQDRRAERLGTLAIPFKTSVLGRRRGEVSAPDQLELEYPTVISEADLHALDVSLNASKAPLFDKFGQAYRIAPTRDALDNYCMAQSRKIKKQEGDTRTTQERHQARMRMTQHIADKFQQSTLALRDTAELWLKGVRVVEKDIAMHRLIDEEAAKEAATAIWDLGHGLTEDNDAKKMVRNLHVEALPEQLMFLGEKAYSDPELLRQNPRVLSIVAHEQYKRLNYWGKRYALSRNHHGDRLTKIDKQNAGENRKKLKRFDALARQ